MEPQQQRIRTGDPMKSVWITYISMSAIMLAGVAWFVGENEPKPEPLPTIQWSAEKYNYHLYNTNRTIFTGLRSDGVIVWRDVKSVCTY
jgi:hypothetical protein